MSRLVNCCGSRRGKRAVTGRGKIRIQGDARDKRGRQAAAEVPNGWERCCLGDWAVIRGDALRQGQGGVLGRRDPWVSKDMHAGDITESELKVSQRALDETSLELGSCCTS